MFPFEARIPVYHDELPGKVAPPVKFVVTPVVGFRTSTLVALCGVK